MSIQPDSWIKKMCKEHNMIEPFLDHQVSEGKISYGLSSMGLMLESQMNIEFLPMLIVL